MNVCLKSFENKKILIVDDEESIRKILQSIFEDAGFKVFLAKDGDEAIKQVEDNNPDLVFLDIWMPGKDGLEVMEILKEKRKDLPIIMISGHATIATAVKATQEGAFDFIEKPLDLDLILNTVEKALNSKGDLSRNDAKLENRKINNIVFQNQAMKGKKIPQRTLKTSAVLYGLGLHSGKKTGIILEPLPANSGIHFEGITEEAVIPAHIDFVSSTGFATTLKLGDKQVATIEHMMSSLSAYRISNLLIKCNGEVPVMDGSSIEFCKLIENVGIVEQEGDWYEIKIDETLKIEDGQKSITVEKADIPSIKYILEYPEPLGRQEVEFVMNDVEVYKKEIATARTFGFVKDINMLQDKGLAQGGQFNNFVLYGGEGPINSELHFKDEAARHKVLDAMGDLYLLGRPICGKITAVMTGHSDNIKLVKLLKEKMEC
ncbi:MAG: UDP-3-O-acyl-N-acetylglucosamine deacetylase [Bdellovibrionota bacterium]